MCEHVLDAARAHTKGLRKASPDIDEPVPAALQTDPLPPTLGREKLPEIPGPIAAQQEAPAVSPPLAGDAHEAALSQEGIELAESDVERIGRVHRRLPDPGELRAELRELRPLRGPHVAVEHELLVDPESPGVQKHDRELDDLVPEAGRPPLASGLHVEDGVEIHLRRCHGHSLRRSHLLLVVGIFDWPGTPPNASDEPKQNQKNHSENTANAAEGRDRNHGQAVGQRRVSR